MSGLRWVLACCCSWLLVALIVGALIAVLPLNALRVWLSEPRI